MTKTAVLTVLSFWVAGLLYMGRFAMLDDALIHLRFADVLLHHHMISYDGVRPSYGASSLLYVGMLATLRSWFVSPLLPKVLSCVGYLSLLLLCATRRNSLVWTLILVLVSPMAVRWLTDGMETSLAALLSACLALSLRKASTSRLFALSCVLTLLRVDLALIVGLGALICWCDERRKEALALAAGLLCCIALIFLITHHILPDTAIAKQGVPHLAVLTSCFHVIGAALSFGVGLTFLWFATAVSAMWAELRGEDRPGRIRTILISNAAFPALVLLAIIEGQQIQGMRYLVGTLIFSTVLNLEEFGEQRWKPVLVWGVALALVWTVELPVYRRITAGRSATFLAMRNVNWTPLRSVEGLSADVGFIGYFSQAPICDANRLINGREAANRSGLEQLNICLADRPAFAFLSDAQVGLMAQHTDMRDWVNCGHVMFTNVGSSDRHELLVRRQTFPNGCPFLL
jgi:hypothetical protein